MSNDRLDPRRTPRDFHWGWYLVPIPFALALLGAVWLLPSTPDPSALHAAQTLAKPAEPSAARPAPDAQPAQPEPEPEPEEQPPTF